MVLKRRTDLAEGSKIRKDDSGGKDVATFHKVTIITGQIVPGEVRCIATGISS